MSLMRPDWIHSWAEIQRQISADLVQRLNSDKQPAGLWKIDETQLGLSRPGGQRIIWVIEGGSIARGHQAHGPDMPAPCVAIRRLKLRAEIRTPAIQQVGIDARTLEATEEVLRAVILTVNKYRPADYDVDEQEESWTDFGESPAQREIVCQYRWTLECLVLGDPHQTKPINQIDATGEIVQP